MKRGVKIDIPVTDPDLEVRWGTGLNHFVFAFSQFWGFMVFWSKNKGGGGGRGQGHSPGSATAYLSEIDFCPAIQVDSCGDKRNKIAAIRPP